MSVKIFFLFFSNFAVFWSSCVFERLDMTKTFAHLSFYLRYVCITCHVRAQWSKINFQLCSKMCEWRCWPLKLLCLQLRNFRSAKFINISKHLKGTVVSFSVIKFIIHKSCSEVSSRARPQTTDTQWRHTSKKYENSGQCGRQNMLRPYLNI